MNWPSVLNSSAALLIGAFLLDLAVGDPRWLTHPVVLMGKVLSHGERLFRSGNSRRNFSADMALSLFLVILSAAVTLGLVALFNLLPLWLSFSATAALASTTLATRGLLDAVKLIEAPLRAGSLGVAREKLARIVGRETADLNPEKVLRASPVSLSA